MVIFFLARDVFSDVCQCFPTSHPSNIPSLFVSCQASQARRLPTLAWTTAQRLTIHYTSTYFNVHNLKKARQLDRIKRRYALRAQVAAVSWRS